MPNWHYLHIHNDVIPALKQRGVTDDDGTQWHGDAAFTTVVGGRYASESDRVLDTTTGEKSATEGLGGVRYRLALEWTALQPGRTATAIFALNARRAMPDPVT